MYCSCNRSNTLSKYFLMGCFCYGFQWPNRAFFSVKNFSLLFRRGTTNWPRWTSSLEYQLLGYVRSESWNFVMRVLCLCCSKLWHKESYMFMNHVIYIHQIKHRHGDGKLIVWRVGCLGPGPLASCRPPFKINFKYINLRMILTFVCFPEVQGWRELNSWRLEWALGHFWHLHNPPSYAGTHWRKTSRHPRTYTIYTIWCDTRWSVLCRWCYCWMCGSLDGKVLPWFLCWIKLQWEC